MKYKESKEKIQSKLNKWRETYLNLSKDFEVELIEKDYRYIKILVKFNEKVLVHTACHIAHIESLTDHIVIDLKGMIKFKIIEAGKRKLGIEYNNYDEHMMKLGCEVLEEKNDK